MIRFCPINIGVRELCCSLSVLEGFPFQQQEKLVNPQLQKSFHQWWTTENVGFRGHSFFACAGQPLTAPRLAGQGLWVFQSWKGEGGVFLKSSVFWAAVVFERGFGSWKRTVLYLPCEEINKIVRHDCKEQAWSDHFGFCVLCLPFWWFLCQWGGRGPWGLHSRSKRNQT